MATPQKKAGRALNPSQRILELGERVEEEWGATPASVCRDLVESMPRRVAAVIRAKGGYTKY